MASPDKKKPCKKLRMRRSLLSKRPPKKTDIEALSLELAETRIKLGTQTRLLAEVKRELQKKELYVETILNQMPAVLWTIDNDYKITSSLGAGLKGLNVSPGELIGKTLFEYLGNPNPTAAEVVNHQRALRGESITVEVERDGCVFATHMQPLRNHLGEITGAMGIGLDVTAASRLQHELLCRNQILEQISGNQNLIHILNLVIKNLEGLQPGVLGSILLIEPDGKRLLFGAAPSLPNEYNQAVHGVEIGPEVGTCGTAAFFGKLVITEDILTAPTWEKYRALAIKFGLRACWSHPIFSQKGKVLGTLAVYFKTPRKPTDSDLGTLERFAHMLAIAIDKHNTENDLNHLLNDFERSNKEMECFVSIASHDLREPLRTVANYVQILKKELSGSLNTETKTHMDFVIHSAKRMQLLISALAEYSKLGRRSKRNREVLFSDVIESAISDLATLIEETGAQISFETPAIVSGDPTLLSQLMGNLLTNAIKYRGKETPKIHLSCQRNDKEWLFQLRDNGRGLDMKYASEIFELFRRISSSPDDSSLGLGLALCKRIIETHHGKIWVESSPGLGTSFFFTLPAVGGT